MSRLNEVPQLAVAIAIYNQRATHILLQQFRGGRSANLWGFPGGKVDPGESPYQAAYRELWEESGIPASSILLDGARYWSYDYHPDTNEHFACLFFNGMGDGDEVEARITEPDKTIQWRWTTMDECRDLWGRGKLLEGCGGLLEL